jgi:2-polyprenyl-3-methyl-5-hydroxy-6-metoxy-1,4-benzoquinol methylase
MTDQNARVVDQCNRQAAAYAALVNAEQPRRADPLMELIDPQPTHRLLDVGCGSGQFAVKVAPRVAHVTGIDLTQAMLEEARRHAANAGVTNIRWEVGDSVALPVDNDSFDVVVSRSMFHHAADPAATLAEMRRACIPGGRIFVSDLSPEPAKAPAFDAIELLRDPSHKRALTEDELLALGANLRLTRIAVRTGATSLPLEAVLATSFPPAGMVEHVRELIARDAIGGGNLFGLRAKMLDETIWVTYPTISVGWLHC